MAQVHIQRIPEEYQKNITARVIDYLDDSVRDSLTEAIWDDLVAISKIQAGHYMIKTGIF